MEKLTRCGEDGEEFGVEMVLVHTQTLPSKAEATSHTAILPNFCHKGRLHLSPVLCRVAFIASLSMEVRLVVHGGSIQTNCGWMHIILLFETGLAGAQVRFSRSRVSHDVIMAPLYHVCVDSL